MNDTEGGLKIKENFDGMNLKYLGLMIISLQREIMCLWYKKISMPLKSWFINKCRITGNSKLSSYVTIYPREKVLTEKIHFLVSHEWFVNRTSKFSYDAAVKTLAILGRKTTGRSY